jgi:hypothetical protein
VDGHDRTLGERVAQLIFVRKTPPVAGDPEHGHDQRKEQAL